LFVEAIPGAESDAESQLPQEPCEKSEFNLKEIPFKIVFETYRETDGKENWELFLISADGSDATNLTQTKDIDEMYPHVSPDGMKVCFVVDEGTGRSKIRNVYYMNMDGNSRVKVADNAREPCWSPDGKFLAYWSSYGVSYGISILSMETGQVRQLDRKLNFYGAFYAGLPTGSLF
jgi:Tol biopolymer transport system component